MKKTAKVMLIACVLVMIYATVAVAAVPSDSVIIGNKAFAIAYLTDPTHASEIQEALDNADPGSMWYSIDGLTTGWTGIFTGSSATAPEIAAFPEIQYRDAQGSLATYAAGNGDVIPGGGDVAFEVMDIY